MTKNFLQACCWIAVAGLTVGATQAVAQTSAGAGAPDWTGVWMPSPSGDIRAAECGPHRPHPERPEDPRCVKPTRTVEGHTLQTEWSDHDLPFTPAGLAQFNAHKPTRGPRAVLPPTDNDPQTTGNPEGLYRTLRYSRPIEFAQIKGQLIQLFGWGRIWRIVYTDGRPVPDDVPEGPFWFGYSVGHWEGTTLVVNTLALDGRDWLDEWGTPISDTGKVVEHWQQLTPDKLELTLTVNDPATYSKPWTSTPIFFLRQKGVEPQEIIMAAMDEQNFTQTILEPALHGAAKH